MEDQRYWLALNMAHGVGPMLYRTLLDRYRHPREVLETPVNQLLTVPGVTPRIADAIKDHTLLARATHELEQVTRLDARILTVHDTGYPENLRHIHDPPPVLYVRGHLTKHDAWAVALVGSRRSSPYGRAITTRVSGQLGAAGITVVSGLARGIDTAAHKAALGAGGRTLAVLGCGIDIIYPPENHELFYAMVDHGALLSEFPLGTRPEGKNFPRRNRLISGLCLGVVVVEATRKSGSLITAGFALEQGREVFAVPGNVGAATSEGVHRLLREGARLVETAEDILVELAPQLPDLRERDH
jgi:DNA processing protein